MKPAKTYRNACTAIGFVLLLLVLLFCTPAVAQEPMPQMAPMLPVPTEPPPITDGHGTGFIPPPMNLSHLTERCVPLQAMGAGELPSSWDWRDYGKVTSVKNQGSCGSCYAFAAIANVESEILIDNAATLPDPDYSENNAKECNWEELYGGGSSCSGGNYYMLANFFSQKGLVLESCDPYKGWDTSCNSDCPYQKTLLGWRIISGDSVPDTTTLKEYIYATASPVFVAMYTSFSEFYNYDGSYTIYKPGDYDPTHAVLIVGWDDNLTHAGGTGGWIVKNSWGTDWGGTCGYGTEAGYFTIAYDSASIGKWSSFMYDWQDYDNEGGLMNYDEAGWWNTSWGYPPSPTAWGLCKFIPSSDTYATRVEFWTPDAMTDVGIYLYDDFDGTALSNLRDSKLNLSFNEPGYHSVQLDEPLPLTGGDDINVVVKFTTAGSGYPIIVDNRAYHETGKTYISCSGTSGSWLDLGAYAQDDIAIRLRTTNPATITTCNATGATKTYFQPGESVYVKGSGLAANANYKIWIQNHSVKAGDSLIAEEDASGSQEPVTTDSTGSFGPTEIWAIPGDPCVHHDYDIIVDKQLEGEYTDKFNYASDGETTIHVGMCGDVGPYPNGNGFVDMGDVILLLNHVGYPEDPTYALASEWAGDCRCDNEINMGDVILLLNHVGYPEDPTYALDNCD